MKLEIVLCKTVLYKTICDLERSRQTCREGSQGREEETLACGIGSSDWKHKGPQLENVDELTARTFSALGRMMHANRLLMARMSSHSGASHGEIVTLALLSQREGINQKELGEILHLSASRVSILVDSLEKDGALERHVDETDRRLIRLRITAKGRRLEKTRRELLGEYVNRTIGALSEVERRELERLLIKLGDKTMELAEEESAEKTEPEVGVAG